MRESECVLDDCWFDWEIFQHGLELGLVGLVVVGEKFYALEHHVSVEGYGVSFFVVLLPDVHEGLQADSLDVWALEEFVDVADDAVEARVIGLVQHYFPFDLSTGCGVVGLAQLCHGLHL